MQEKDTLRDELFGLYDGLTQEELLAQEFAALEKDQLMSDIKSSLQHPYVQRVLWRFLERAGILHVSFNNTGWTGFYEGRREQGLFMLKMLETANPDALSIMRSQVSAARKQYSERSQEKLP